MAGGSHQAFSYGVTCGVYSSVRTGGAFASPAIIVVSRTKSASEFDGFLDFRSVWTCLTLKRPCRANLDGRPSSASGRTCPAWELDLHQTLRQWAASKMRSQKCRPS
jgi:hypothetical protein